MSARRVTSFSGVGARRGALYSAYATRRDETANTSRGRATRERRREHFLVLPEISVPVVTLDARATHNAGHTRSMVRFKKIKSRAGTRTVSVADAERAEATRNAADDDDPFGNYPTPSTRDANEDKAVKQAVKPKNKKSGVWAKENARSWSLATTTI